MWSLAGCAAARKCAKYGALYDRTVPRGYRFDRSPSEGSAMSSLVHSRSRLRWGCYLVVIGVILLCAVTGCLLLCAPTGRPRERGGKLWPAA